MDDGRTLGSYNIQAESDLRLIIRRVPTQSRIMRIFIKNLQNSGEIIALDIDPEVTVESLQQIVQQQSTWSFSSKWLYPHGFHFFFNGQRLEEKESLDQNQIQQDYTLLLVAKLEVCL